MRQAQKEGDELFMLSASEHGDVLEVQPVDDVAALVQATPEDVAAIDRLAEITQRDKNECLQAYMACDKNEEMAANFLFTSPQDD